MPSLKRGATLKTLEGESLQVVDILGEGGQGIIYRVRFRKEYYALKWYKKIESQRFYDNLKENVARGSPAPTFLWPLAVTEKDEKGGFGYVMQVKPDCYKDFSLFILNRVKFSSFAAVINAALQITASFKTLHNKGLSYQDLNDGNFFINPETGDVLIGDNDNVAHDGENLGIQGKPRYVAPEVVMSQHKPDTFSDRFSLAVILFMLLFRNHPLAGVRDQDGDDPDENELNLYCKNPVFIFDPEDESNRPKVGIHVNALKFWPVFPAYIQELFQRAFHKELMRSDGAHREDRIIEREWLKALVRLRRDLFFCANCGNLTFYPKEGEQIVCMNCNKPAEQPAFLDIGGQRIPLQPGLSLYRYDIDATSDFTVENIREEIGLVVQNQKDSRIWGLKNLSNLPWYRRSPGGKEEVRMTGEVIPVIRNNSIKFGTLSEGTIK